jgi:hypothetical protein
LGDRGWRDTESATIYSTALIFADFQSPQELLSAAARSCLQNGSAYQDIYPDLYSLARYAADEIVT